MGKGLLALESKLFFHWHRFKTGQISRETLLYETASIVKQVGLYLEQGSYTAPELKVAGFCKNLLKDFSSLWLFLEEEGIEPTNNHAERCLRFLVIWRKKYFSTYSEYGSEFVARMASVIMTLKLSAKAPFAYLTQAIESRFSKEKIPLLIDKPITG